MVAEAAKDAVNKTSSAFGKVAGVGFTALKWGSTATMAFALVAATTSTAGFAPLTAYAASSATGLTTSATALSDGMQYLTGLLPS